MSFILYAAFDSWKWVSLILACGRTISTRRLLSLLMTGTHFPFPRASDPGADPRFG